MIAEFTSRIAKLVAHNKRLERDRDGAKSEVEKYQGFAQKAATSGVEDDARKSLELKNEAQKRLDNSNTEITRNKQLIDNLRGQLSKARAKVASAKRNIVSLEARHEGAKVRTELAKASSEFNTGDSPLAALDDLDKAVNEQETEAEAWEELSEEDSSVHSLVEKYGSGGDSDVDTELAALMAKSKG